MISTIFSKITKPFLGLIAVLALAACEPGALNLGGANTQIDPGKPVVVALLVPSGSGSAATDQLAQSLVNAANMAVSDIDGVTIDLRIYNTGGDETTAAEVTHRAIADGAQVFVGPLFSTATSAVAGIASRANLNVMSFSNNPAVAGGNVYILGTTFETVADRLISYTVSKGQSQLAIVHQEGSEGSTARAAVETSAAKNGAQIVAVESYPLNFQGLSERAEPIAEVLKSTNPDTVFFTDSPTQGLGFMAAALATNRFRTNRDAQFLGLTRWDTSTEVLASPSLQGGWFAVPDPNLALQFETRYQLAYGVAPHPLSGLAYDGIAAIGAMLKEAQRAGSNTPFASESMTNPSGFAGVQGIFRFLPNGQNQRGLAILQAEDGVTKVVDPAPRSFGGGA